MVLTRSIGRARLLALVAVAALAWPAVAAGSARAEEGVPGMDVSDHQPDVDWAKAWADGARFAYVKATEGVDFHSGTFDRQYDGAKAVGMLRGAYHVGLPDRSSGAAQALYFANHGGAATSDGRTLPGALDIEPNPYGEYCYGLNPSQLSAWLAEFSNTYRKRSNRYPAIYTTTTWWNRCTARNTDFAANHPLWLAHYAAVPGPLPAGWAYPTIWQFGDAGTFPGDQNRFNGSLDRLQRLAG